MPSSKTITTSAWSILVAVYVFKVLEKTARRLFAFYIRVQALNLV